MRFLLQQFNKTRYSETPFLCKTPTCCLIKANMLQKAPKSSHNSKASPPGATPPAAPTHKTQTKQNKRAWS